MATTRQFGIVTSVTGLTGGICVNSMDFNQQVQTATATNETGQITDMAGYTRKTTLTAQGVLDTAKGTLATAGSILTIGGKNYLITTVQRQQSASDFVRVTLTCQTADNAEIYIVGQGSSSSSSSSSN